MVVPSCRRRLYSPPGSVDRLVYKLVWPLVFIGTRFSLKTSAKVVTLFVIMFCLSSILQLQIMDEDYGTHDLDSKRKAEMVDSVVSFDQSKTTTTTATTTTTIRRERIRLPRGVCPSLKDIQNLEVRRTLDLNETTMDISENTIFGKYRNDVVKAVLREGNGRVEEVQKGARNVNAEKAFLGKHLSSLEMVVDDYVYTPGGHWRPVNCTAKWKVAILIPFRNREFHLPIVLRYLIPFLQKQLLEFAIFVVNQENDLLFNRAMLLNVGFVESLNFTDWDCFILHDVDYVPLSERNYYGCEKMPRRMISGSDKYPNYGLSFKYYFGGVVGVTKKQVQRINGFPNVYWGWGGEDDEILRRFDKMNIPVYSLLGPIGYFNAIQHNHESAPKIEEKDKLVRGFEGRFRRDGLNNLRYNQPHIELHALYTNISVDIENIQPKEGTAV